MVIDGKFYDRRISEITSPLTLDIASGRISVFSLGNKINFPFSYCGNEISDLNNLGNSKPVMVLRNNSVEDYIFENSTENLILTGEILEERLKSQRYIHSLTDFLVYVYWEKLKQDKKIILHVDADFKGVTKLKKFYKNFDKPDEFSSREFSWYSNLDWSMGDTEGSPGYEHPSTREGFMAVCSGFCESFLLGKRDQLDDLISKFSHLHSIEKIRESVEQAKTNYDSLKISGAI